MRLYEQERLELSHHPPKFGGRKDCGRTDFNLSHDLSRPRGQSVMWLYGQKPLKVSHYHPKLSDHKDCDRGDIMIFQEHVIKVSCDFMGRNPLR